MASDDALTASNKSLLRNKPGWMTFAQGRIYRPTMKVMHRLGWCYPQPSFPEGNVVWWCHWCGLRGHHGRRLVKKG